MPRSRSPARTAISRSTTCFSLIINGGGSSVSGIFNGLAEGSTFAFASDPNVTFEVSYTANNSNNTFAGTGHDVALEVTSVPEPGTWGMVFAGLGVLVAFQHARRRKI